jgi:hypothetical protein
VAATDEGADADEQGPSSSGSDLSENSSAGAKGEKLGSNVSNE